MLSTVIGWWIGIMIVIPAVIVLWQVIKQWRLTYIYRHRKSDVVAAALQLEQMGLDIDRDKLEAFARGRL